ncbi:MAG: hypothetical protein M1820_010844 [Bogoriella megaspora]|nr:MAG: hypothetical protein M1820_010844 [Bogoriella megaspora]
MHFLIIGGSGRTGRLVVSEALSRGHQVTVLLRDPSSIPPQPYLKLISGTPTSQTDLSTAFSAGSPLDAVIVTLSARRETDSPFSKPISPPRFMADCAANIISEIQQTNLQTKLVIMSTFGTTDSFPNMNLLLRLMLRHSNMKYQTEDHDAVDQEVKASGVKYVLVRPNMLEDSEEVKEVREWGDQGAGTPMLAKVTRGSVAGFLVQAAEGQVWDGRTPVITN